MGEIYLHIDIKESEYDYDNIIDKLVHADDNLCITAARPYFNKYDNGYALVISLKNKYLSQGQYDVLFEGLIENKAELCNKLDISVNQSDEALLSSAYLKWGEACARHIKGDYSYVIINRETKEALCSRSPFGLLSMYYYFDGNKYIIATSHQKYMELKLFPVIIDFEYLVDYFANFDNATRVITPYSNWKIVQPGESIIISQNGVKSIYRWKPKVRKHRLRHNDTIEEFKELLINSVKRKIHDNSFSHYYFNLSGGIDSSAIACALSLIPDFDRERLIVRHEQHDNTDEQLLKDSGIDKEQELAQMICNILNVKLHVSIVKNEGLFLNGLEPLRDYAEPSTDILYGLSSCENSLMEYPFIMGYGGDQILSRDINLIKRRKHKDRQLFSERMFSIYEDVLNPDFVKKYNLKDILNKLDDDRIFDSPSQNDQWEKIIKCDQWVGNQDSYHTIKVLPFIDTDLIEYCLNLPDKYLTRKDCNKYIIREAFEKELPQEIYRRKGKTHHVDTIYGNIRDCWHSIEKRYSDLMLVKLGIMDKDKLIDMFQRFKYGTEIHILHVLRILAMELWLESKKELL